MLPSVVLNIFINTSGWLHYIYKYIKINKMSSKSHNILSPTTPHLNDHRWDSYLALSPVHARSVKSHEFEDALSRSLPPVSFPVFRRRPSQEYKPSTDLSSFERGMFPDETFVALDGTSYNPRQMYEEAKRNSFLSPQHPSSPATLQVQPFSLRELRELGPRLPRPTHRLPERPWVLGVGDDGRPKYQPNPYYKLPS